MRETNQNFLTKISVIIPIHNVSKYLKKCLKSVQNQENFDDFEVLMLLDSATKDDEAIADKFISDNRFKKIKVDFKDQGLVRNYGIKIANGKYLCFVDGDDYIEKNCLRNFYDKAEKCNADVVISNYYLEKNNKKKRAFIRLNDKITFKSSEEWAKEIAKDIRIRGYVWNKFYRKDFLIENQICSTEARYCIEDVYFNYICFLKAKKICCSSKYNYVYVFRKSSSLHFDPITFIDKYLRTLALMRYYSIKHDAKKTTDVLFFTKKIMLIVYLFQNFKYIKSDIFKYSKYVIKEINNLKKCKLDTYLEDDKFIFAYNMYLGEKNNGNY